MRNLSPAAWCKCLPLKGRVKTHACGGRVAATFRCHQRHAFTRLRQVRKSHFVRFAVLAAKLLESVCMSRAMVPRICFADSAFFKAAITDLVRWKKLFQVFRDPSELCELAFFGAWIGGRLGEL